MDLVYTLWGSQLVSKQIWSSGIFLAGRLFYCYSPLRILHRSSLDVCEEMMELLVAKGSSDCLLRELYQKAGILMQIMTT